MTSFRSQFQTFTDAERTTLRRAGTILRDCLAMLRPLAAPGRTTAELDRFAEDFIRARGGEPAFKGYHQFPATLCTSRNDVVVHGIPSETDVLCDGDIVSLDCGVRLLGLYTDACITVCVGETSPAVRDFVNCTEATLEDVITSVVRAGIHVGDISAFIQQRLQASGYQPVRVLTGHGLGSDLHQFPDVPNIGTPGTGPIIPEGAYIAIEPIAVMGRPTVTTDDDGWTIRTKDRSLACHTEHCLFVTAHGAEILA